MKILYPFSGVAAIFFPRGKLDMDGTCEFASKKCLQECGALKNIVNEPIIGHEAKMLVYNFVISNSVFVVCHQIEKEMKGIEAKILYWFASGDCPKKYTLKIFSIMKHLALEGIIQLGFTRNKPLWEFAQSIKQARLVLTVERLKYSPKINEGILAVPDYQSGEINLYQNKTHWGSCGGEGFKRRKLNKISNSNCNDCFNKKEGCFFNFYPSTD